MSRSKTDTTSHLASADHLANSPSSSPHKNPCKPLPHSVVGSQSRHSTAPFPGHLKPLSDSIFAPHVRRTRTRFSSFSYIGFIYLLSPWIIHSMYTLFHSKCQSILINSCALAYLNCPLFLCEITLIS